MRLFSFDTGDFVSAEETKQGHNLYYPYDVAHVLLLWIQQPGLDVQPIVW